MFVRQNMIKLEKTCRLSAKTLCGRPHRTTHPKGACTATYL